MNLRPGSLSKALGVPFSQLRILGLLTDDGVLHDGVAEVIHDRRDGENAAQPLIQTFSGLACLSCAYALSVLASDSGTAVIANPATMLRRVIEIERVLAIDASLEIASKGPTTLSTCTLCRSSVCSGANGCVRIVRVTDPSDRRSPCCLVESPWRKKVPNKMNWRARFKFAPCPHGGIKRVNLAAPRPCLGSPFSRHGDKRYGLPGHRI